VAFHFAEGSRIVSIPLTFDWATVAWLCARLRWWWRGRAGRLALLAMLGIVSGCVPALQYEETQSAAAVEKEGRRRSEEQLQQLKAENEQLRAKMLAEKQASDERDQALSQAALDTAAQGKQREDAEGMVEQLRGELARVGSHLQTFHDDKQKLEQSLSAETAHGQALARLSRDVALSFSDPLATSEYSLDTAQDSLLLRLPRGDLLTDTAELGSDAPRVLDVVARLLKSHEQAKLRVEDSSAPGDAVRVQRVVAALTERGVAPERFVALAAADVAPDSAPAPKPATTPEIVFGFSVP
jgi:hypothetical protein